MKHFRIAMLLALIFLALDTFSQSNEKVEMADVLRQDGKIYTVVVSLVIMLTAMIILLIRVDKKVDRLSKEMKRDN
ncbi:MAG: CcmD family protein [Chryseolinea sp.]